MAAAEQRRGAADRGGSPGPSRGIPDGMLIGGIALLLGLTVMVWSATGLAGMFAKGSWPDGLRFIRTPVAMRRLIEDPQDLPTAWPDTPKEQLSGYGLFWGILISELMVLFVVLVFVIGTVARYRIVRADRLAAQRAAREKAAGAPVGAEAPAPPPARERAPEPRVPEPRADDRPMETAEPLPPDVAPAEALVDTAVTETAAGTPSAPREQPSAAPDPIGVPAPRGGLTPRETEPNHSRVLYGAERGDAASDAVLEAYGPVLVVTSDPELWSATKDARGKLGPVHVFDPSHLIDTPARLRWNPASGCEAKEVAAARSAALLAPVRPVHAMDRPTADAAETLLRCWLHAAAVDGRPFRQVHRWAQGSSAHEPVRILRTHQKAAGGAAGELEATLTAHPERRDMAQELTARALGALSSIHIRDACNPGRADAFAVESFINEGGTLYLVGESIEDPRTHPGAMPLLTALASSVVEHGRRMAERSSPGRLDPPLTLVLDDVAAVAPIPALPELLARGADQGMPTLALMRSQEQARARWPRDTLVG